MLVKLNKVRRIFMSENRIVLGLIGSSNKKGRTNELVSAALAGAAAAGAATELLQMSEHVVEACRDCLPWVCATNLKCSYKDDGFELLSKKILDCGALVIGTPVYWGDTSGMVKYLFIKMCRVFARSGQLKGLPALGMAIAGGTGNGFTTALVPLYNFFRIMQMRAIEPVPATRFDLDKATKAAETSGHHIGEMVAARSPFESAEECWLWYDSLPYLGENRTAERRQLAAITVEAVPAERQKDINGSLARADILAAAGRHLDEMKELSKIYGSAVKIISEK